MNGLLRVGMASVGSTKANRYGSESIESRGRGLANALEENMMTEIKTEKCMVAS